MQVPTLPAILTLCTLCVVAACGDSDSFDDSADRDAITFASFETLPSGDWLVYNDWNSDPDSLYAIDPAEPGAPRRKIFESNRIWSVGISRDADAIAFAAFDELQTENYGVTFGDTIMPTYHFEIGRDRLTALAIGNLNDECHQFDPSGDFIYVCRRYDWTVEHQAKGWRLGRIDRETTEFEFLRDYQEDTFELSPRPLPDPNQIIFETRDMPTGQNPRLYRLDLSTGEETLLAEGLQRPVVSPDGRLVVVQNRDDSRDYYVAEVDDISGTLAPVGGFNGSNAAWGPDSEKFAYTVEAEGANCEHVQVAEYINGQWTTTRIRDCVDADERVTTLSWIRVP